MIRKEYEDFYKENKIEYTEEDIHSEIVARLVGERLQSEKFLKRYAEKDASMIKRAAGLVKRDTKKRHSSSPLQKAMVQRPKSGLLIPLLIVYHKERICQPLRRKIRHPKESKAEL